MPEAGVGVGGGGYECAFLSFLYTFLFFSSCCSFRRSLVSRLYSVPFSSSLSIYSFHFPLFLSLIYSFLFSLCHFLLLYLPFLSSPFHFDSVFTGRAPLLILRRRWHPRRLWHLLGPPSPAPVPPLPPRSLSSF